MMQIRLLTLAALAGILLTAPRPAAAHHGWAEFDDKKEITFEATVTDFHFVNPHCVVEFSVQDDAGQVRKWQGEFSNPVQMTKKGWNAASMKPGDRITIAGHPSKNNGPAIHVTRIRLPGGRELKLEVDIQ